MGAASAVGFGDRRSDELHGFDRQVLKLLQADGRLSNADLAQKVNVSAATWWPVTSIIF